VTQPVPEESNEALHLTEPPEDEHDSALPDEEDDPHTSATQEENAEAAVDQPSDGAGSD
jgi:hypothetical protein